MLVRYHKHFYYTTQDLRKVLILGLNIELVEDGSPNFLPYPPSSYSMNNAISWYVMVVYNHIMTDHEADREQKYEESNCGQRFIVWLCLWYCTNDNTALSI
jgi:hypothetical protein